MSITYSGNCIWTPLNLNEIYSVSPYNLTLKGLLGISFLENIEESVYINFIILDYCGYILNIQACTTSSPIIFNYSYYNLPSNFIANSAEFVPSYNNLLQVSGQCILYCYPTESNYAYYLSINNGTNFTFLINSSTSSFSMYLNNNILYITIYNSNEIYCYNINILNFQLPLNYSIISLSGNTYMSVSLSSYLYIFNLDSNYLLTYAYDNSDFKEYCYNTLKGTYSNINNVYTDTTGQYVIIPTTSTSGVLQLISTSSFLNIDNSSSTSIINTNYNTDVQSTFQLINTINNSNGKYLILSNGKKVLTSIYGPNNFIEEEYFNILNTNITSVSTSYCNTYNFSVASCIGGDNYFTVFYGEFINQFTS